MSDELTRQMLEHWLAASEAAANKPDQAEVAKAFGDFVRSRLAEGSSAAGAAASLQALLTNDGQEA